MSDTLLSQETASEETTEATTEEASAGMQNERPEWLPEKFRTPEDLAKSYGELTKKLTSKEEDLKAALKEELLQERYGNRPESAGDYQLPDFVDQETAPDSELLNWWANHAYEQGYSQEQFEDGIRKYFDALPPPPDLEAETKKLGDSANDRIRAASIFASSFFPKETLPAIERLCESAEGIIALEAIMEATKDGNFGSTAAPAGQVTREELAEMMKDPRYSGIHKDPAYVQKVNEGFQRLYNG